MKAYPREAHFANLAGMATAQSGDPKGAITLFSKALKLAPGAQDTQNNLVQALLDANQHAKAREMIDKLIEKRPQPGALLYLRALSHMRTGEDSEAEDSATQAIDHLSDHAPSYNLRGVVRGRLGKELAAIEDFRRSHELNPRNPEPLANMAAPLARTHQTDKAFEALNKALSLAPNHVIALHRKAILLNEIGRKDEAIAAYHAVLAIDPLLADAYSELVLTQSADQNAELLPALKKASSKLPRKSPLQLQMNFALGNLYFKQGDYETAAHHLAAANAQTAAQRPYSASAADAEFEKIREMFPVNASQQPTAPSQDPFPVFVLGQPRSGTTLTEMILSTRADVAACDELPFVARQAEELLRTETQFDAAKFAEDFRTSMPSLPEGTVAFVDKMPTNYRFVGYILQAFPNARIVHIERDPRDVALSMWRVHFTSHWMNFAFELKAMAHNANLYRKYMTHWSAVAPDRILSINYADIVSDIDASSRRMADFCGLEWVQEMTRPDQNLSEVKTASVVQVREGVHTKSLGGWRRMEKALKPFTDALDPDLWPDLG